MMLAPGQNNLQPYIASFPINCRTLKKYSNSQSKSSKILKSTEKERLILGMTKVYQGMSFFPMTNILHLSFLKTALSKFRNRGKSEMLSVRFLEKLQQPPRKYTLTFYVFIVHCFRQ